MSALQALLKRLQSPTCRSHARYLLVTKPVKFSIRRLSRTDKKSIRQAAQILTAEISLPRYPSGYKTYKEAREEVMECLTRGYIALAAFDGNSNVLGWIGGRPEYRGKVWELHPLVVRHDAQRNGIGRALVEALEAQLRKRGALTLRIGADDEDFRTSLSGVDLYKDLPKLLRGASTNKGHPMEFYRKVGFTIVGVMPDADGIGMPDIILAKRLH